LRGSAEDHEVPDDQVLDVEHSSDHIPDDVFGNAAALNPADHILQAGLGESIMDAWFPVVPGWTLQAWWSLSVRA
jgi:hypothetical protein